VVLPEPVSEPLLPLPEVPLPEVPLPEVPLPEVPLLLPELPLCDELPWCFLCVPFDLLPLEPLCEPPIEPEVSEPPIEPDEPVPPWVPVPP
jgi:hypothetical protein